MKFSFRGSFALWGLFDMELSLSAHELLFYKNVRI